VQGLSIGLVEPRTYGLDLVISRLIDRRIDPNRGETLARARCQARTPPVETLPAA